MTIQKTDRFEDGYLTVFLSLILTVMISLSLMLILGARENTRRMAIECVTDIGMDSILAEYHRELLKQYDLFFIDTSYGTNEADYAKTEKHLLQYVQKNLGSEDLFLPFLYSDPLRLQAQDAVFTQASDAADMGGAVLRRQAVNVMYQRYGVAYLKQLETQKPVVFCGDLNVAHQEIDLKNPKSNHHNAGFTDEERACFTRLIENGFIDTFRYFYPDKTEAYSWWSYMFKAREKNAGWRIDYFLASKDLQDRLESAAIHSKVLGSDHCPVELCLR